MRGVIVFLAAFLLFLVITLGYQDLPPGRTIYDALDIAESDYEVVGIPITNLAIAIFNGVIYGVIVFLVYWLVEKFVRGRRKTVAETKKS